MKKHTFLVSDESINNYGFKVLTKGIDTTQFERNPIMLYMHKRPTIIGKWENLTKKDGKLYADAIFDVEDEEANKIAGKVARGFLKGASIGISFKESDKKDSTIKKCQLHEISIVDLGANDNALRLYNESELVTLNLEELTASGTLIELLDLSKKATHTDIVDNVKALKKKAKNAKKELAKIKTIQSKEAEFLVDMLVERKLIKPGTKNIYLHIFAENFVKGKEAVTELLPLKRSSLLEYVENHKLNNKKSSNVKKPKADWNLEDYRKYAPNELENNQELYKELVNKQFNKQ